jgi:hypothetical protein
VAGEAAEPDPPIFTVSSEILKKLVNETTGVAEKSIHCLLLKRLIRTAVESAAVYVIVISPDANDASALSARVQIPHSVAVPVEPAAEAATTVKMSPIAIVP